MVLSLLSFSNFGGSSLGEQGNVTIGGSDGGQKPKQTVLTPKTRTGESHVSRGYVAEEIGGRACRPLRLAGRQRQIIGGCSGI